MQSENRFFDDLSRMAGGAMNAFGSLRAEFEGQVRQQLETLMARMKLVTREEFDAAQAMLVKAREEQEALAARVAALEAQLGDKSDAHHDAAETRRPRKRTPPGESET